MNRDWRPVLVRGLVHGAGLVSVLAVLSWYGLVHVVTHAEGSLPAHPLAADVIVPLAGSPDRVIYAKSLLEQGVAPDIMSTLVDPICLRERGSGQGCATHVRNTIDEAMVLRRIFNREHFTRAIIVTSPYHLARAAAVFRIVFVGSETTVHFVSSPKSDAGSGSIRREAMSYLPSLAAALIARSVPTLYEWTVQGQSFCQDAVALSRK